MVRRGRMYRSLAILSSLVVVCVLLAGAATADTESPWTGSSQINIVDEGEIAAEQASQLNCNVAAKVGTRLKSSTRDSSGNLNLADSNKIFSPISPQCYYQNKLGNFSRSGNYWSLSGSNRAVRVYNDASTGLIPITGDTNGVVFTRPSAVSGRNYSFNFNLPAIGRLDSEGTPKELIYRLSSMSHYTKYSDSSLVNFDSSEFSSNGRYMVALLSQKTLVRIDLETFELTPIAFASYTGAQPNFAISNDGRFVMSGAGGLKVYDLLNCQNKYAQGQWPANIFNSSVFSGCLVKDVFTQAKTVLPPFEKIGQMRFAPDGMSLQLEVNWRDGAGFLHWHRMSFKSAGFSEPQGYLAMGDSFASGEGDTEGGTFYEPGTDNYDSEGRPINLCHLSRRSYPYLSASAVGYLVSNDNTPPSGGLFHSIACSGATSANILSTDQYAWFNVDPIKGWIPGYIAQKSYMASLDVDKQRSFFAPSVVTLSIGGNDLGFVNNLLACLKPGTCGFAQSDPARRATLLKEVAQLKPRFTETYRAIMKAAPGARLYVLGYPKIVQESGGSCAANVLLNDEERIFISKATHYFNQVIKSAATEVGTFYVDVEDILNGVNLCSGAPASQIAVNGVTAGNDRPIGWLKFIGNVFGSESYHPNQLAQLRYRDQLLALTNNLNTSMPAPLSSPLPVPEAYFGTDAQNFINTFNNPSASQPTIPAQTSILTGKGTETEPEILAGGFAPNSLVKVEIHSVPTDVGTFTVNQEGKLAATLALPNGLEPGIHELHLKGTNFLGEPVDYYQTVVISESESDLDGDGVPDSEDVCLMINPSGEDVDQDGIDDACDADLNTVLEESELADDFVGHEPNPAKPSEEELTQEPTSQVASATTKTSPSTNNNPAIASDPVSVQPTSEQARKVLQSSTNKQNKISEKAEDSEESTSLPLVLFIIFIAGTTCVLVYFWVKKKSK